MNFCILSLICLVTSVASSAIDVQMDDRKMYNHIVDSLDILCYVTLLCLTIITLWAFKHKRVRFLRESGFAILYGVIVGLILRFASSDRPIRSLRVQPQDDTLIEPSDLEKLVNSSSRMAAVPDRLLIKFNLSLNSEEPKSKVVKEFSYKFNDEFRESEENNDLQQKATFNPELFFYVILPPIIFHAGYSMQRKSFFDNLGAILAYSLAGTVVSTLVIALVVYCFAQLISSIEFSIIDMLYFGAIMSATDPCSVLSIFNDLRVDSTLNGLILGESLLNDAVALVLCSSIEEYSKLSLMEDEGKAVLKLNALLWTIVTFFKVFFGSVFLGCLVGCLTSVLTKFTRVCDHPLLETSLFFLLSYTSYLIAEISNLSGIVSVLLCGIFQAHYTFRNLSSESQLRTKQLFEILNFLTENFIFSYIGVSLFTFSKHKFNVIFIFGTLVAIAVGRAVNIYPISALLNMGRVNKIPISFQHMLWFSGLRGAMAFALSMRNTVTEIRQLFFSTTCIITIGTVICCGGMVVPVMSMLQIPTGTEEEHEGLLRQSNQANDDSGSLKSASLGSVGSETGTRRSAAARAWSRFDATFMKPLLTKERPSLLETMPEYMQPFAKFFTSSEQLHSEDCQSLNDPGSIEIETLR